MLSASFTGNNSLPASLFRQEKPKPRAGRGALARSGGRLFLAEGVVAAAAGFRHAAKRGTHAGLVLGARRRAELRSLGLEGAGSGFELGHVLVDVGLGFALFALRTRVETVPGHAREVLQEGRITRDDVRVVGRRALQHRADR